MDRVIDLEGVHNFRDYGGYPVAGGGRLRRDTLWRSGQHHDATDADLDAIAALGLVSIFDLRSAEERETHACRRPEGFSASVYFDDDPEEESAPHAEMAKLFRFGTAEEARESMRRNYGTIAFRPGLARSVRHYLSELAEDRGPTLVHCMAGKDRTGISVVALHLATGVHRDDIVEDYLLTNRAGDVEARIAAGMATMTAMAKGGNEEVMRVMMGVEPEYLESAFRMMEDRHGSIDGYLHDVLGVDQPLRDRLRQALVES